MKSTGRDPTFEYEKLNIMKNKLLDNEILKALPSSVIVTDLEGHIYFMNRFLDIWLVQEWVETGTNLSAVLEASQNPPFIQPSDLLLSVQDEINRFGEASGVLSLVNGAHTQYNVRRIKLNRLVWTFTDTSSIKRTEEFAEFYLDLMGHDIRNRLQEVMLYIEILEAGSKEQDYRNILSHMFSAILKCGNLIKKIKTTEKLDLANMEENNLTEIVAGVIDKLSRRFHDAVIEFKLHSSICKIQADKYLPVLIENIIENGIIHNTSKLKHVWVSIDDAPWGYELCVSDNGPGIETRRKRNIFDKQRRYGGIGLHITSMIIEKYGGNISIHDRLQNSHHGGAMVKVWFPERTQIDFEVPL